MGRAKGEGRGDDGSTDPAGSPTTVDDARAVLPGLHTAPFVSAVVPTGPTATRGSTSPSGTPVVDSTTSSRSAPGPPPTTSAHPNGSRALPPGPRWATPGRRSAGAPGSSGAQESSPWSDAVCATQGDPSTSSPFATGLTQVTVGSEDGTDGRDARVGIVHERLGTGERSSMRLLTADRPVETFLVTTPDGYHAPFVVDRSRMGERGFLARVGQRVLLIHPSSESQTVLLDRDQLGVDLAAGASHAAIPGAGLHATVIEPAETLTTDDLVAVWQDATGARHATDGTAVHSTDVLVDPSAPTTDDPATFEVWYSPDLRTMAVGSLREDTSVLHTAPVDPTDPSDAVAMVVPRDPRDPGGDALAVVAVPSGSRLPVVEDPGADTARLPDPVPLGSSGLDVWALPAESGARTHTLSWHDPRGEPRSLTVQTSE